MFEDFWRSSKPEYIRRNSLFKFLSKHFILELSDNPDFLIYSCFGYNYLKYDCIRIFFTGENVRPNFEECDYSFSFDYPINDRNYRLPIYRLSQWYDKILKPRQPIKATDKKKFCSFLYSNTEVKERNKFYQLLSKYKKIDSGGKAFNNTGYIIPRKDTIEWLQNYKFNITFENSSYPGYTTEKLLHALVANTVPIYWGNPLVAQDFNPNSFINCHDYNSFEEVAAVIRDLDNDDESYNRVVNQLCLPEGQEQDFCREKNIVKRFEEIFSGGKAYISSENKRKQKSKFFFLTTKRMFLKRWIK